MIRRVPVYKIRVVYKSGYYHSFEVFSFKVDGGRFEWKSVDDRNKPIMLGADEVAAVFQVGFRRKFVLGRKK